MQREWVVGMGVGDSDTVFTTNLYMRLCGAKTGWTGSGETRGKETRKEGRGPGI